MLPLPPNQIPQSLPLGPLEIIAISKFPKFMRYFTHQLVLTETWFPLKIVLLLFLQPPDGNYFLCHSSYTTGPRGREGVLDLNDYFSAILPLPCASIPRKNNPSSF